MKNKKGQAVGLNQMVPIILILVTVGIVIGAGALILEKFAAKSASGSDTANSSYYVTKNATAAIGELASFLPTIGIIIAAVIIIGLIVSAFAGATGRR